MTVATRMSSLSLPASLRATARMAMIWSPSTTLPSWSTARQRSASPSWAMPRSAPCSSTARLSGPRWVDPTPSLMLRPSGSAPMTVTSAPASLKTCGREAARRAVGAVEHDLQAVQAVRERAEQVDDVAVLGVGEALDAPDLAADRAERLLAELFLDGVFHGVRELLAAAGEELDAVVRGGVVRGGDHHAEVGVQVGHQVGRGRGRKHAGVVDVDPGAGEPRLHGGRDELTAGAGVPRNHGTGPRSVGIAVMAKHDGGGLSQLQRQLGGQQAVRQAPDTICSK